MLSIMDSLESLPDESIEGTLLTADHQHLLQRRLSDNPLQNRGEMLARLSDPCPQAMLPEQALQRVCSQHSQNL